MKILRKTKVKQVITPKSKAMLEDKFNKRMMRHRHELDQLQFEKKKMLRTNKFQPNKVEARFKKEESRRKQAIKWCEFQLEKLETLPMGSEIVEREVEEIVEVSVGDSWEQVTGTREIIIKDGIVERIDG